MKLLKAHRNLCKVNEGANPIGYPCSVLPRRRFKKIKIDRLNRLENVCIVRRSNFLTHDETFDRRDLVYVEALRRQTKDVFDYSMNLLGGRFTSNYIKFIQSEVAQQNYKIHSKCIPLRSLLPFISDTGSTIGIYFNLNSLHNHTFPYQVPETPIKKKKDFEKMNLPLKLAVKTGTDPYFAEFKGRTTIRHSPTNSNFWHVELDVLPHSSDPKISLTSKERGKSVGEQLAKMAFDHVLKVYGKKEFPSFCSISPKYYSIVRY